MSWENRNLRKYVQKRARERAGAGWTLLGEELREALEAQVALGVLMGQALPEYRRAQELIRAALGWNKDEDEEEQQ